MIARFSRGAEPRTGHQPQERGDVAKAPDGRGHEDGAERTSLGGTQREERAVAVAFRRHTLLLLDGASVAAMPCNSRPPFDAPSHAALLAAP